MKLKVIVPVVVVVVAAVCVIAGMNPLPAGGAENVLVVRNGNSPVSCRIAAYYASKRSISGGNIVTISIPDSSVSSANETISYPDYRAKIEAPIHDFLFNKGLSDKVQYIVLTKGIPIMLPSDPASGAHGESVDSMLAALDIVNPMVIRLGPGDNPLAAVINRYWRSSEPFSHSKYGGYLVTRLDGYTEADAKALVDRALAPRSSPIYVLMDAKFAPKPEDIAKQPLSFLLPDGTGNRDFKLSYADFDADMVKAGQIAGSRPHVTAIIDQTKTFIGSDKPLTIYCSWGSNAHENYKPGVYHSIKFAPRGIVETGVSTSGRSFLPTTGGQSMIADLIAQGAAGAKCYVTEPYITAVASPSVMVDLYTSGRNLAESYYAASRFIGWKDIVLGDPLCKLDVGKPAK